MTIVLFILKIIGAVILAVLGIVLLVILAVLFVPFRYQICVESGKDGKQDNSQSPGQSADDNRFRDSGLNEDSSEDASGQLPVSVVARVHWLLHFLGAEVSFRDGELDAYLRILFWRKKLLNNEEAKEDEAEVKKDTKTAAEDAAKEAVKPPKDTENRSQESEASAGVSPKAGKENSATAVSSKAPGKEVVADKNITGEEKQITSGEDSNPPRTDTNGKQKNLNKDEISKITENENSSEDNASNKKENKEEKSDGIITRIWKIWNDFSNFRKKITRMAEDERNHRAVAHVKMELIRLFKAIRPGKLSIDLVFSLGSPDLTGEVLGACALFPIFYQNGNRLIPDFEADKAYAMGNADAKGRIYLFQILFAVLGILFDKDCKRMYRMFRKYFG